MSGTVKERRAPLRKESYEEAMGFRQPMQVREIMVFGRNRPSFPVCPRCELTLEREYMAYCDRCGQCLGWKAFKKAAIIYPGSVTLP